MRGRVVFSLYIVSRAIIAHITGTGYCIEFLECNFPTSRILRSYVSIFIQSLVPCLCPPIDDLSLSLAHIWGVTWQELRELKSEIEHIQRLLEKGR